jgi:hypothetical protein
MLRKALFWLLLSFAATGPASAQSDRPLREMLSELFTFGDCGQPLCLDGSINAENGHGDHYLPAVASGNLALISFIEDAIGKSISGSPLSATSSGATFTVVGGIPVRSTNSAGPIFAEQSRTLGGGNLFVGFNISGVNYTTLGGVSTDNITLNFVHQDVDPEGSLGDPVRENDLIRIDMDLNVNVLISSVFMTYGLTDFIDMGVAVPFVRTSIAGTSMAQIEPFGTTAIHFFDGSVDDPILNGTSSVSGSAAGIGDIVGRLKVNLGQGNFTPHLNVGYLIRTGELQNDAILATLGFDERMASWATLALELMSQWQVGDNKITLPGPIQFNEPFPREVPSTGVTVVRENLIQASAGAKFRVRGSTILLTNVIIPLTKAGLQPSVVWTAGLEFGF